MCSACDASTPIKAISSAVASTAPCVIFMNSQKERVPITVNRHTDSKSINMQDYRLAAYPTDYGYGDVE